MRICLKLKTFYYFTSQNVNIRSISQTSAHCLLFKVNYKLTQVTISGCFRQFPALAHSQPNPPSIFSDKKIIISRCKNPVTIHSLCLIQLQVHLLDSGLRGIWFKKVIMLLPFNFTPYLFIALFRLLIKDPVF